MEEELVRCPACFEDLPRQACFSLCCAHFFCRECFEGQLCAHISDGPACVLMTCPAFQCSVPVALSTVMSLCRDPSVQTRYVKFLTHHFIGMNARMRFCPGSGCEQIAYGRSFKNNVECGECGEHFCFKCGGEAHDPCSCEQLRLWNIKCIDDNETLVYLDNRTRPCPSCRISMEVDAINCGYMKCRSCAAFFCWHCMQVTDDHRHRGGQSCNKYVEDSTGKDDSEKARKR
jgi:ariadne-1